MLSDIIQNMNQNKLSNPFFNIEDSWKNDLFHSLEQKTIYLKLCTNCLNSVLNISIKQIGPWISDPSSASQNLLFFTELAHLVDSV